MHTRSDLATNPPNLTYLKLSLSHIAHSTTSSPRHPCRKEHGDGGHSQRSVFCMPLIFANLP